VVVYRTVTENFILPEKENEGIQMIMEDNDMLANG
jgi:hypothetical protein